MKKKVDMGLRIIMGLMLIAFGLNKFFNFMPAPEFSPEATAFYTALGATGYLLYVVGLIETVVGVMLVTNRFVALALILQAPLSVNIILFHTFLDLASIPPALIIFALNIYLATTQKLKYATVLAP